MVSLAQMTVAGFAGYGVAIFGTSSVAAISLGWPWWLASAFSIVLATRSSPPRSRLAPGAHRGHLHDHDHAGGRRRLLLRTGAARYYTVFNGFGGLSKVAAPEFLGVDWKEPVPFYFVALACALVGYFLVKHLVRAPFGIALQGASATTPRRMESPSAITSLRTGVAAYAVAGLSGRVVGGVLMASYNGRISPGTVNLTQMIAILIVAVLGGRGHPIGAFIGAIVHVLLQNFAIDLFVRERFNLVIGGVFLAIVLFSPDGLLGLWAMLRSHAWCSPSFPTRRGDNRDSNEEKTS